MNSHPQSEWKAEVENDDKAGTCENLRVELLFALGINSLHSRRNSPLDHNLVAVARDKLLTGWTARDKFLCILTENNRLCCYDAMNSTPEQQARAILKTIGK